MTARPRRFVDVGETVSPVARRRGLLTAPRRDRIVGARKRRMFSWFQKLLPRRSDFFGMFEAHAATLVGAADALNRLATDGATTGTIRLLSEFGKPMAVLDGRTLARYRGPRRACQSGRSNERQVFRSSVGEDSGDACATQSKLPCCDATDQRSVIGQHGQVATLV